jgi:hypothetical protein
VCKLILHIVTHHGKNLTAAAIRRSKTEVTSGRPDAPSKVADGRLVLQQVGRGSSFLSVLTHAKLASLARPTQAKLKRPAPRRNDDAIIMHPKSEKSKAATTGVGTVKDRPDAGMHWDSRAKLRAVSAVKQLVLQSRKAPWAAKSVDRCQNRFVAGPMQGESRES